MSNIRTALIKFFYSLRSRFRHLPHPLSKSWRRSRPAPFHAPPENEIIYLPNQSMATLNVTQHTMAGCQRSIMPIHAIFYHSFPSKPHLLPGYATDSSRWYWVTLCWCEKRWSFRYVRSHVPALLSQWRISQRLITITAADDQQHFITAVINQTW